MIIFFKNKEAHVNISGIIHCVIDQKLLCSLHVLISLIYEFQYRSLQFFTNVLEYFERLWPYT